MDRIDNSVALDAARMLERAARGIRASVKDQRDKGNTSTAQPMLSGAVSNIVAALARLE